MLSKLAFLLQKSSDDYWVIWLKATCLSWRPREYLSWRTGVHLHVLYLSLVKRFPTLLFLSNFWLGLLKEDLQIRALNLPSIFRYLFPRASNLGGFVKSDFQPTWSRVGEHYQRLSSGMMMMMMMMKMKYSSKNCHPSSLVSGMPHENVFFCVFYQE